MSWISEKYGRTNPKYITIRIMGITKYYKIHRRTTHEYWENNWEYNMEYPMATIWTIQNTPGRITTTQIIFSSKGIFGQRHLNQNPPLTMVYEPAHLNKSISRGNWQAETSRFGLAAASKNRWSTTKSIISNQVRWRKKL